MIDLGIGNFLTLITEFIAIRAGLGFFGVPPWAAVLTALGLLYSALLTHRYWTWERVTLTIAVFNLVFVPVALLDSSRLAFRGPRIGYVEAAPGWFE